LPTQLNYNKQLCGKPCVDNMFCNKIYYQHMVCHTIDYNKQLCGKPCVW